MNLFRKNGNAENKDATETPVPSCHLKLIMMDGNWFRWTLAPCERARHPWNHFRKWFHGRQSKHYVMNHTNGSSSFRREDIRRYEITYEHQPTETK